MILLRIATIGVIIVCGETEASLSLIPKNYNLQLEFQFPNDTQTKKVLGSLTITGVKESNSSEIFLHVKDLQVLKDSVKVKKLSGNDNNVQIQDIVIKETEKGININLQDPSKIQPGDVIQVEVNYTAEVRSVRSFRPQEEGFRFLKLHGDRYAVYGLARRNGKNSEGARASALFPSLGEPYSEVEIQLTVSRPLEHQIVFTSPLLESVPDRTHPNLVIDKFDKSNISTNEFALLLITSNVRQRSSTFGNGKTFRVFDLTKEYLNISLAANVASKILSVYDSYFNTSGIEVKEVNIVYVPFGNNYLDLRYKFNQFTNGDGFYFSPERAFPSVLREPWMDGFDSSLCYHGSVEGHVRKLVEPEYNEVERGTSAVLYSIEDFLTFETLRKGLNAFIVSTHGKSYGDEDFYNSIQNAADTDERETGGIANYTEKVLRDWCRGHYNYNHIPIIILDRVNSTHVKVTQEKSSHEEIPWRYIPLKITSGEGLVFRVFLEDDGVPKFIEYLDTPTSSLLVDKLNTNYFRILYNSSLADQLDVQLRRNHSVYNNYQQRRLLIKDYSRFAYDGRVNYTDYLNLIRYFDQERDMEVWRIFFTDYAIEKEVLRSHPDFPYFEKFIATKLDLALETLLGTNETGDSPYNQIKSILLPPGDLNSSIKRYMLHYAITFSTPLLLKMGKEALKEWKAQGAPENIPEDLFILMIKSGTEEDINYFYDREKMWSSNKVRYVQLSYLLRTVNDIQLYNRLLQEVPKDPNVFSYKSGISLAKRKAIFSYLEENIDNISIEVSEKTLLSLKHATQDQFNETINFVEKYSEKFGNNKEGLKENIRKSYEYDREWMDSRGKEIMDWAKAQELSTF